MKHKQKEKRNLRQELQKKSIPTQIPKTPSTSLKFGSFNINGLDLETSWAAGELLEKRGFDVRKTLYITINKLIYILSYQVLALSETHARSDKPSVLDPINGYKTWNTDRGGSDKGGGGLTLLYRDSLTAHEHKPTVPSRMEYISNERQWLLVTNGKDRIAFLHIYIACKNNRDDSFLLWNEDLFFLVTQEALKLKQKGFTILSMGDFNSRVGIMKGLEANTPDHNQNTPMFLNFLTEVNLLIINTLPIAKGLFTRFMDSSGRPGTRSLLDYGLVDHEKSNTVTSFIIDEAARVECGSDHALLECVIEFSETPKISWSVNEPIHYNIWEGSSFLEYQTNLDSVMTTLSLTDFSKQPSTEMLKHVSEGINAAAMKTYGLKVAKKKRGRKLPQKIISMIQAKNELSRKLSQQAPDNPHSQKMKEELTSLKSEIKDSISNYKLQRRTILRSKLLLADPNRKKFWRFLKGQIQTAGQITALKNSEGEMVFNQSEIEEAILEHFTSVFGGQRVPVHPAEPPVDQVQVALQEIEAMLDGHQPAFEADHFEAKVCSPYSYVELDQILKQLLSGKASGYDR